MDIVVKQVQVGHAFSRVLVLPRQRHLQVLIVIGHFSRFTLKFLYHASKRFDHVFLLLSCVLSHRVHTFITSPILRSWDSKWNDNKNRTQ